MTFLDTEAKRGAGFAVDGGTTAACTRLGRERGIVALEDYSELKMVFVAAR